jgi:hypothetical protein
MYDFVPTRLHHELDSRLSAYHVTAVTPYNIKRGTGNRLRASDHRIIRLEHTIQQHNHLKHDVGYYLTSRAQTCLNSRTFAIEQSSTCPRSGLIVGN